MSSAGPTRHNDRAARQARAAILKIVHPDGGGPRARHLLETLATRNGVDGKTFVAGMIERGELLKYGDRKGERYGLPRVRL